MEAVEQELRLPGAVFQAVLGADLPRSDVRDHLGHPAADLRPGRRDPGQGLVVEGVDEDVEVGRGLAELGALVVALDRRGAPLGQEELEVALAGAGVLLPLPGRFRVAGALGDAVAPPAL